MAEASPRLSLRDHRRTHAKRTIQAAALDLFEDSGFTAVTIEQVARAAGVGVATVYRYFGTKERIVLWDEYDPILFEHIGEQLARGVLDGTRDAIGKSLEAFYAADRVRILRRARLVSQTPALVSASLHDMAELRSELARVFVRRRAAPTLLTAEVAAGAVLACLQAAVDAWVRAKGRPRLGKLIDASFRELRLLATTASRR